jgi:hypothetical protein
MIKSALLSFCFFNKLWNADIRYLKVKNVSFQFFTGAMNLITNSVPEPLFSSILPPNWYLILCFPALCLFVLQSLLYEV